MGRAGLVELAGLAGLLRGVPGAVGLAPGCAFEGFAGAVVRYRDHASLN